MRSDDVAAFDGLVGLGDEIRGRSTRTAGNTLVAALREHAPRVPLTGLAAGFHAVANLPDGVEEEVVTQDARRLGVGLYGMGRYRATPDPGPGRLVIGFGNTGERAIENGIRLAAPLLR